MPNTLPVMTKALPLTDFAAITEEEIPDNSSDAEIAERIYVDQIEYYGWEDVIDKPT